ncbi:hypothetical protein SAMN02983003_3602 [Devosia enhydra]|uniref:Uncharacterized protein n=1 Tax=Devosia enhydra TaxID=665118 RepID=A0A1K2I211_9HYPH|nr:hypothetical protein [Devosia enhydra]SFZ86421.1 hypothetical protein SAMN02983003_3602 [Devosia enhydra]
MRASNHPGRILPQDTAPGDAHDEMITGMAVSQTEIEDLLYGDDRPVAARVDRLRELADEVRVRASGDLVDDDARALLGEIERAISELSSDDENAGEPDMLDGMVAIDPLDHRETLSPDSDELEAIEEIDLESLDEDEADGLDETDEDDADGPR